MLIEFRVRFRTVIPLAAVLTFLLSAAVAAEVLKIGGTGGDLGTMRQLGNAFEKANPGVTIEVLPSLGSGGGIRAIAAGAIDLAISSRPLKNKEKKLGIVSFPYAKTAMAIVVKKMHGLSNISRAELVKIYDGSTTTWPDGIPVRIVLRPLADTDTIIVKTLIPEMELALSAAVKRRGVPIGRTDQLAARLIERLPGGVGILSLSLVLGETRPLKFISLDGVAPTSESIGNGYPLVKIFYMVTSFEPAPTVQKFIEFVRSLEGQVLLKRTGHVGVGIGG